MKITNIFKMAVLSSAFLTVASCSDWLEPQSINNTDYNTTIKTDEYFAALREWKQTPGLPQVFVWFDNWSGTSPTGANSLTGLPDSVTIASNWASSGADTNKFSLSAAQKADMEYVQKVKGTKVVFTMFSRFVGEGLPYSLFPYWYDENKEYRYKELAPYNYSGMDKAQVEADVRRYAQDLYKACIATGYDGYDMDYEPGYGMGSRESAPMWYNTEMSTWFMDEMSYWFGRSAMDPDRDRGGRPMPERRLLLLIDGAVGTESAASGSVSMPTSWPSYNFDYYVLQTYGVGNQNSLARRVTTIYDDVRNWVRQGLIDREEIIARTIFTENFESYASTGGQFLTQSQYVFKGDFEGLYVDQQIGGCGLYRVGFDYNQNGDGEYYYLRQGITNIYRIFRERGGQGQYDPCAG